MPFITEEIWSTTRPATATSPSTRSPEADESLFDADAEADVEAAIDLTRRLRAWRDLVEVPVASTLTRPASTASTRRSSSAASPASTAARSASRSPRSARSCVLASAEIDAEAVATRLEKRREELRAEVQRAERKLANEGFVAKAPVEVVEEERGKLERYRAELEELAES